MHIADLSSREFGIRLSKGICLQFGPFYAHLSSDIPTFSDTFRRCYSSLRVLSDEQIAHFRVAIRRRPGLRARLRPQAEFLFEGLAPFDPYPLSHAFPMFEWGLNWCIANTAHQYLMLHAAVVERGGRGLILPAPPGSGKSTLCTALVGGGWRLLSDEFGLLSLKNGQLHPLPRAAPLKNASIDVIRTFAPGLSLGPRFEKTRKGLVSHVFPPAQSLLSQADTCPPGLLVFPHFIADSATRFASLSPVVGVQRLIGNSFNYLVTGEAGFAALCDLVRGIGCYELKYSRLEEAVTQLDELLAGSFVTAEATPSGSAEPEVR